jgi:plasmid stabilization system protein ParE
LSPRAQKTKIAQDANTVIKKADDDIAVSFVPFVPFVGFAAVDAQEDEDAEFDSTASAQSEQVSEQVNEAVELVVTRGAGRPRIGRSYKVHMRDEDVAIAKVLGDGVMANGIRLALMAMQALNNIDTSSLTKTVANKGAPNTGQQNLMKESQ